MGFAQRRAIRTQSVVGVLVGACIAAGPARGVAWAADSADQTPAAETVPVPASAPAPVPVPEVATSPAQDLPTPAVAPAPPQTAASAPIPAIVPDRPLRAVSAPAPVHHVPVAAYVVPGIAVVGLVVGTIFGIKALGEKRDFENGDRTTQKVEAIEATSLYADMAFGAGLTFGVAGAFLWWTEQRDEATPVARASDAKTVVLAPLLSPSGTGATAVFRF